MQGDADSDDDDDGKRVVRSHKDKRWDQMTETIAKMKNSMKNNDWNAVTDDFAALHKLLEKAKQIVAKEGLPTFYFKALLTLDVALQKALADKPVRRPKLRLARASPPPTHPPLPGAPWLASPSHGWVKRNLCCLPMERCDGISREILSDRRAPPPPSSSPPTQTHARTHAHSQTSCPPVLTPPQCCPIPPARPVRTHLL